MSPNFTVDQAPGLLGQLGYVGVFLLGMAALGYAIVWVVKSLRGTPLLSPPAGTSESEIKLLVMGAAMDLKMFIEEKARINRHDHRNTLNGAADRVDGKLDELAEELRGLQRKAEQLEELLSRWRPPT